MTRMLLTEKLRHLYDKYAVDDASEVVEDRVDSKKMMQIKKKLAILETERCQCRMEGKDLTDVDAKIAQQKKSFQIQCHKS